MKITPLVIVITSAVAAVFSMMVYANNTYVTLREFDRFEERLIRIEKKLDYVRREINSTD